MTIAARDGLVYVRVSGVRAPLVSARIEGGLASGGKWFGWVALRQTGPASWYTVLRATGFLGVYPLELRVGRSVIETARVVRILPRGFAREPAYRTPRDVADRWAHTAPQSATATRISTWSRGFFTHRDARYNRLMRVLYELAQGRWRTA